MTPRDPLFSGEELRSLASRPAGYLLHRASLLTLGGILFLAAWKGHGGIVLLLALVLSAAGLAALWSRLSLAGVRCRRVIRERRLFPGESTEVTLELFNRKPLPLPWVRVDDQVPAEMAPDPSLPPAPRPGFSLLTRWASLFGYRKATWGYRLQGRRRGFYLLGPLTVSSGDIFGFYPRCFTARWEDSLLVYPRIFPLEEMGIPPLHPLGETRSRRRLFPDPSRAIGLRDYRPQDSLRHVHWKASARRQHLQVKVFEPTANQKISIFLAADGYPPEDPSAGEDFELAVSAAASIAYHSIEEGTPAGLITNACLADSGLPARFAPGGSRDRLMEILEALAKATSRIQDPAEAWLRRERADLAAGTTLVLIASRAPEPLVALLADLKESGHKPLLLLTGGPPDRLPAGGIPFLAISGPAFFPGADPGGRP